MPTIASFPSRRLKAGFAAAAIVVALAGCSSGKWGFPYKAPVQQGNWVTQEQVALLQPGMSRAQVRFALGSPTLTSALHADRWDYPYFFKPGYGAPQERKFTVWFDNDKLTRWVGDEQPTLQPFQLANQDVKRSEEETKQTQQDAERAKSADGRQLAPDLTLTPGNNPAGSGPAAAAPSDTPPPLQ